MFQQIIADRVASDEELVAILQQKPGDEFAFGELYQRHRNMVARICLKMTHGDVAETEEFVQEVFLKLYESIGTFRGAAKITTWLHRVAVNVVLEHFRRKSCRISTVSLDASAEDFSEQFACDDRRLLFAPDCQALIRAIAELPKGFRSVFILREIEGYTHKEVAQILGSSLGNSKSQNFKARKKLRRLLSEDSKGVQ